MYMDYETEVSVIVPIYNAEKYLNACLFSIQNQTFKNFEVLLIDDGSSDSSGKIAMEFSKNDKRFRYLHLDRGGVANARNHGLEMSKGKYIGFVDSDDTVEKEYLYELYTAAEKNGCEISSCNYSIVKTYPDKTDKFSPVRIRKLKEGVYSGSYYTNQVIKDWSVRSYLWNKLFRRELFFDYNISFPSIYFEDIATVARVTFHANTVAITDKTLYNYYIRENSIMTSPKVEKINDYVLSYGILKNYIAHNGKFNDYKLAFFRFAFIIYFANYYNVFELHFKSKNFHGWIQNQHITNKNILYFASRKYKPDKDLPQLPQYALNPWDYR